MKSNLNEMLTAYVFTDESNNFGNPVGIIIDEENFYDTEKRISITRQTGYSECIFINDLSTSTIRIYTSQREIAFAGHAAVGAAYSIAHLRDKPVNNMIGIEGEIKAWREEEIIWVRADLKSTPCWWHEKVASPQIINSLSGPQVEKQTHAQLWAWEDEESGFIRSRTFASDWGIQEDEANGSGCMRLAAALGRKIKVLHGHGSIIHAQSIVPGTADVGGLVRFK